METMSMFDLMYPSFKIDKPIRLIELFGGIGSQAKSLKNIGANFQHHKLVEFDKYAVASYNAIHGTEFETTDITKTNGKDLEITDANKYCYIMTYSFPCQDLSVAGKMKGMSKDSGTRSGLLWEVERLLNEVEELPQVLLMENVPQVIGKSNIEDFHLWQRFLENKGYMNYTQPLNAMYYGIPQNRNRVFMVSILGGYSYKFPKPKKLKFKLKDIADFETKVPRRILKSFLNKKGEFGERFKTQSDDISVCINTKSGYAAITNNYYTEDFKSYTIQEVMDKNIEAYANSPKMNWLLMGFSEEDFYKAKQINSDAQLYKQAGNSIVVDVLEGIFKQML